MNKGEKSI